MIEIINNFALSLGRGVMENSINGNMKKKIKYIVKTTTQPNQNKQPTNQRKLGFTPHPPGTIQVNFRVT